MSAPEARLKLTVGGAVNPRTSVYIIRPSDDELLELLERGEYCNVLCSRQMGKTSLLKRTRARLVERGYATAEIEVAGLLGSPKDADEWYQGLLDEIARQLRLTVNVPDWWRTTSAVTANQKLIRFFREEVIAKVPGDKPVIIFLDEIDSTLKLPYTDDFFVAIRAMYNDRASDPVNERIAFCLVGVATPNELIKERRTTPYNIGRTIELRDFDPDRDDFGPIYRLLCPDEAKGEAAARAVIRETGGHPYLTLRVCDELAVRPCPSPEEAAAAVRKTFGSLDSLRSDVHFDQMLRFINDRVDDKLSTLDLYRRVIGDKPVPDQTTPAHINLKLIGLAKRDGRGNLAPRNPVYQRLFTDAWARSAMPPVERRVRTARRMAVAAVALLLIGIPVAWYATRVSNLNAQAAQFDTRALNAEVGEKRDEALLWRLKALATRPNDPRARAANEMIQSDYPRLLMTFRPPPRSHHLAGGEQTRRPERPEPARPGQRRDQCRRLQSQRAEGIDRQSRRNGAALECRVRPTHRPANAPRCLDSRRTVGARRQVPEDPAAGRDQRRRLQPGRKPGVDGKLGFHGAAVERARRQADRRSDATRVEGARRGLQPGRKPGVDGKLGWNGAAVERARRQADRRSDATRG
jgi:hypothetical protein